MTREGAESLQFVICDICGRGGKRCRNSGAATMSAKADGFTRECLNGDSIDICQKCQADVAADRKLPPVVAAVQKRKSVK